MHQKHRSKQDYETPDDFLAATKHLLGIQAFAFDYAATPENAKATHFWTPDDDSLSKSPILWSRPFVSYRRSQMWGWLNPPYTNIGPWTLACAQAKIEGARIAMLVPAGVGSNWFRDHVFGDACVLFLNGRLTFVGSKDCYPKDCLLLLWASDLNDEGCHIWTWKGEGANTNTLRRRLSL
jgi:phage N-6-adenine-methyltransferase